MYTQKLLFLLFIVVFLFIICKCYNYIDDAKLNKCFYTVNETYPNIGFLTEPQYINDIILELSTNMNENWSDWPEHELLNKEKYNNPKWNVLPLKAVGKWHETNITKYPKTYNCLKNIPGLINAAFSKLGPYTTLNKHQGWANLANYILRCHLGLIISTPSYIYCENEREKQEVGKLIIFDDSKEHWADNQGDYDRIVLIMDIKRPHFIELGKSKIQDSKELTDFIKAFNDEN